MCLLPGWYDDWVVLERERLRQLQLHALDRLAAALLAAEEPGRALDAALVAVQADPLRESAHRIVVRIHLREGNAPEALRAYERFAQLLSRRWAWHPPRTCDVSLLRSCDPPGRPPHSRDRAN